MRRISLVALLLIIAVVTGAAQGKGKAVLVSTWNAFDLGSEGGPYFLCPSSNGTQTCAPVVRTIAKITPESTIKVLRIQFQYSQWLGSFDGSHFLAPVLSDGSPCGAKSPRLTITNGTTTHTIVLSEVSNDSGSLSLTFPAGSSIRAEITAGAVPIIVNGLNTNPTCNSVPAGNLTVQYTTTDGK
jgi:hypothetical protein